MSTNGKRSKTGSGASMSPEEHVRRWNRARHTATAFANTAAFLYERDLKQVPPVKPVHVVPFIVNSAFAIELYLKALAHRHNLALAGHELLKLYDSLPEQAHRSVQAASAAVAIQTTPPQFEHPRSVLSELNNAFVEWRYLHEKRELGPLSLGAVVFLLKVMHASCSESVA